ncbi:MAG: Trk family potassium uptake protein [Nitrospirae bacterium]|nr:Trk family potassium uptake protein [Nitrospirota bacterium]
MEETTFAERIRTYQLTPTQILALGYAFLISAGTILLSLPFAAADGRVIEPLDALFTATSAICVTGLITKDTPADFSLFGQIVILVLFQIGGLGYMTFTTIMAVVMGKRIGLRERLVIQETLSTFGLDGLIRFTIGILQFAILAELIGAVLLTFRFVLDHPPLQAFYLGIFHSVSAFNNAGFSLFSSNLTAYRNDWVVNGVVMMLVILGGLGFLVYHDLLQRLRKEVFRLSLHTKLVLITSLTLTVVGAAAFLLFERQNPSTLQPLPFKEQLLTSFFQSVSARTAGFNTVDIGALTTPTLYLLVLLMFIGASPGSTGGGVKTSTFAVMAVALWSTMRAKEDVTLFHRRISPLVVAKAFFLASLAMILVTGVTLVLLYSDHQNLQKTLFEVASASGTVGLSTGDGGPRSLAALFGDFGKSLMILCMILGRIGPVVIGITAMTYIQRSRFRYPEGKVMIG